MSYSFTIFLAFLACYFFFRLWSVLGSRSGYERSEEESPEADFFAKAETQAPQSTSRAEKSPEFVELRGSLKEKIEALQRQDSSFDVEHFLEGACGAFKMITEAFATGKREVLEALLKPEIYKVFTQSIMEREREKQTIAIEIKDVLSAELEEVHLEERDVALTVRFVSEQIVATANADGEIIDNPERNAIQTTDVWTFERALSASGAVWALKDTQSL